MKNQDLVNNYFEQRKWKYYYYNYSRQYIV